MPIYEISNQKEPIFFSGKSALVLHMLHMLLVPRMPTVQGASPVKAYGLAVDCV